MLQSSSGNFPEIFVIFRVFLVPLKQFLDFSGIVFALKINSKKTKPNLTGRARRPDPVQHAASREAHRPEAGAATAGAAAGLLGVRARDSSAFVPI
jgi:hypothetical protein